MGYVEDRADMKYYKYIRNMLVMIGYRSDSILDVGSNGVDLISHLPCKTKVSIDLNHPLEAPGIEAIKGNFLNYKSRKFDVVTCFQVLEHIDDENIKKFCKQLMLIGGMVVVSVPYLWPANVVQGHLQDPVDENKLYSWFEKKPIYMHNIIDGPKSFFHGRLFAVFIGENISDDIDYKNLGDLGFFLQEENFNQEKFIVLKDRYELLNKKLIEKYAILSSGMLTNDEMNMWENRSKENLFSLAMNTKDIKTACMLWEIGEKLYPFWFDVWGHPVFLKEWIRLLLKHNLFDEARGVLNKKISFYEDTCSKESFSVLFSRRGVNI